MSTKTQDEMMALERSMAYELAVSALDGMCLATEQDGNRVFDLDSIVDLDAREIVAEAVEYLHWRGLLDRPSANGSLVTVRNESEARHRR